MVLTILLAIGGVVAAIGCLVLFSPLQAAVQFSVGKATGGCLTGSFLHPRVITVAMDFVSRKVSIRLFGWAVGRKKNAPMENSASSATIDETSSKHDTSEAGSSLEKQVTRSSEPPPSINTTRAAQTEAAPSSQPASAPVDTVTSPPPASFRSEAANEGDGPTPLRQNNSPIKENVAPAEKKKDNWFERLRHNRYVFFVGNHAWRRKVIHWVVRVVRALFTIVRFNRFTVSVRAGVEDPMLTGTIAGLHRAAAGALAAKPPFAISFEPVFMMNHFECNGTIDIRTSMAQLLLPLIIAVATFPTLHTLYIWWRFTRLQKRWNREASV